VKTRPSIADVARLAGVGAGTVSRVLNRHPNVRPQTRQRVEAAMREIGYVPNLKGRGLRTGRTGSVSLLLPNIGTEFYERLLAGLEEVFDPAGLDMALFPVLSAARLARYNEPIALPFQADGLLLASLDPAALFREGFPVELPAVLVDAYADRFDSVYVDNLGAAELAVAHLLTGPGEFYSVFLTGDARGESPFRSPAFTDREVGVDRALAAARRQDRGRIRVPFSTEGGRVAAREILARCAGGPASVFAACDELAIGLVQEFKDRHCEVGRQVRVVGFDDARRAEEYSLTTIRQPVEELGKLAARLLLDRINGTAPHPRHLKLPAELIRRASG
jgi:LacI family transcriptional regulator